MTHEDYLSAIVRAVAGYAPRHAPQLAAAKVVYGTGAGQRKLLGATHHGAWQNGQPAPVALCEVCAFAQDLPSQVAATTVHELAHAVLGPGHGHGAEWKRTARALGLLYPRATSDGRETWAAFAPPLRAVLEAIPAPTDGRPLPPAPEAVTPGKPRPCSAGRGARGGRSTGKGSGSRMRKVQCAACGYTARVSSRWLDVGAPVCPTDGHGPMVPE